MGADGDCGAVGLAGGLGAKGIELETGDRYTFLFSVVPKEPVGGGGRRAGVVRWKHGGHCTEHRRGHRAAARPEACVRSQRATLRGALASPQEGALRNATRPMYVRWQAEGVRNVSEKMAALWDDSELLQQCALAHHVNAARG